MNAFPLGADCSADVEEEEIFACDNTGDDGGSCSVFNRAVGVLEDLVIEDHFQNTQTDFFRRHRGAFAAADDAGEGDGGGGGENSFAHTDIHNEYVAMMDALLSDRLADAGIGEADFLESVEEAAAERDVMDGDLWELLFSLVDFRVFKEMVLSYPTADEEEAAEEGGGDGHRRRHEPLQLAPCVVPICRGGGGCGKQAALAPESSVHRTCA
eukprot:Rhum_TRINITY_DN11220_c0_g1::Rhum_TRINITY_DN11220_c0_g1_i1::g.43345::m.43345/K16742/ARL2BP, BART; ADP-ribosylation factor-like protein 2-binding protein